MGNQVFDSVVSELAFLGDILSVGIVKKGISKQGAGPDNVTAQQMLKAMDEHITPALNSFVNPEKAREIKSGIVRNLKGTVK